MKMRWLSVLVAPFLLSVSAAAAAECPGNPHALGTSRAIVVDPREHGRIGTMNYAETLPLVDKEVVLTFDDGPLPPYTDKILDILAKECIHATYFIVGRMAKAFPDRVRREYREGHTIGTHSMNHPFPFRGQGLEKTKTEIEGGIAATATALGDPTEVAPFFRFPGLGRTDPVEDYLGARGLMVWSADFPADDWTRISADEIVRRALRRLEAMGKGVLLLHDIHPATVLALPKIIAELKARGYRIVHVMPATADRPKTPTTKEAWLLHPRPKLLAHVANIIRISDVREPDMDRLLKMSAAELCSLKPPRRVPPIKVAARKHPRRPHVAQAPGPQPQPDVHSTPQ